MSTHLSDRGGRIIVLWRALREVDPLLKGYIRLARAETALATGSLRGFGIHAALAAIGLFITLIALVAALFTGLLQSGMPIWEALLWIVVPSLVVAIFGLVGITRRFEYFTLPQTRKRVRMLLELIDEER